MRLYLQLTKSKYVYNVIVFVVSNRKVLVITCWHLLFQKHREWLANREKGDRTSKTYSPKDNEVLNDNEQLIAKQNTTLNNVVVSSTESSISTTNVTPSVIKKTRQKYSPHWTTWSNWSDCTRSCGSGVMSQQRKCVTRYVFFKDWGNCASFFRRSVCFSMKHYILIIKFSMYVCM